MNLRREFMLYDVSIIINDMIVAKSKDPIEASAPCKALELFSLDNKHSLRKGVLATGYVTCHSTNIAIKFEMIGVPK